MIDTLRPTGERILAKLYVKPESVKGIILPEEHRPDETLSLYEVVRWTDRAEERLGQQLRVGDIIQTPPFGGVFVGSKQEEYEDGRPYDEDYFLVEASQVRNIVRY
jgi:co-chaperonin GroES (HSP10)